MRHAGDNQAETGPRVEPLVGEVQLTRTVAHEHGGEGGTEAAAAGVEAVGHVPRTTAISVQTWSKSSGLSNLPAKGAAARRGSWLSAKPLMAMTGMGRDC